jgi:CRP/FNR family cyclic AMP-dependent transcriptional regulator
LLDILGPNELFGLSSLGKGNQYEKLAISTGKSDVRMIPADHLRHALATRGDMAVEFIQILAQQLRNNWTEGSTLIFADCRARLIQKLLWFANSPAARHLPEGIELRITHAQLAQSIGAARETVSLCLMSLRRENLVRTGRNRVMYDPASLCKSFPDARPVAELAIAV